ncbi:MAG: chorismate mutase [Spartobacteria bacterium]|nr:chorismate mutase [Spartobacteria bacterium]
MDMLALEHIRAVLSRLEETIIFGLIERAQFAQNKVIYQPDGVGPLQGKSLFGFMLYETECTHAKVRRYTSPDEHPFNSNLPEPMLTRLTFSDSPLYPNDININDEILPIYQDRIIPRICDQGDDGQYGSSSVNDVQLIQSISKRIHYGKFVAESKYRADPAPFDAFIAARDADAIMCHITFAAVEKAVLDRVYMKACTYSKELNETRINYKVDPEAVRDIYAKWIIPMNKQVQIRYLLGKQCVSQ